MDLAFTSLICPGWDLERIIRKTAEHGFKGFELASKAGLAHLHAAPELSKEPGQVVARLKEAGVQLVCLATSTALGSKGRETSALAEADIAEHIKLAASLGCPFVRLLPGEISAGQPRWLRAERRETVLGRTAAALAALAPVAALHKVTLLVENRGDFADSASLWQIIDSAGSPMIRACWNPLAARITGERPTTAIPRLASKIAMVRISDGVIGPDGRLRQATLPGQGTTEVRRTVQLLRGIGYRGYLVVDWLTGPGLAPADPGAVLPAAASYLKLLLEEQPAVLTAYKGDKFRPRQGREFAVQSQPVCR